MILGGGGTGKETIQDPAVRKLLSFSFFLKFIYVFFFFFWLHWVFVAVRGLSLVAVSGGFSCVAMRGLLNVVASLVAVCRLQ